jgi:hypothetical protein
MFALLSASRVHGQTVQGQISGTVTDPSGNVVPGAEIALKSLDTNTGRNTVSSASGVYFLPSIPPGRYSLTISAVGFQSFVVPEILLTVNQSRTIDAQMTIGAVKQTVQVSASAVALDTTTANIGTVVQHEDIVEMPLNGRNFTELILLTPGTSPTEGGQQGAFIITGGISPPVNGMRPESNNFTLDGAENNQRFSNSYAQSPPPDAIAEFKVDSHQTGADVSLAAGANVNLVTRSGDNAFHGSLWDFLRNNDLNARNFFDNFFASPTLAFRQNQFGYYLGGPVFIPKLINGRKTRTYFSTYFEGLRFTQSGTTTANVPNAAERTGNLSDLLGAQIGTDCLGRPVTQGEIYDPTTTVANPNCPDGYVRNPYPNNTVPSINPVAQAYMTAYYPLPNRSTSPNLALPQGYSQTADQYGVRIDQTLSDRQQIYGRFSHYNWVDVTPTGIPNNPYHSQNHGTTAQGHYNRTFSPTFILDFLVAYNRSGIPLYFAAIGGSVGDTLDKTIGPTFYNHFTASGNLPASQGLGGSLFTSPFSGYSYELANPDTTWQYNADFKKVRGKHQMAFGFRFTRFRHYAGNQGTAGQGYSAAITGLPGVSQTGEALASFMDGYPTNTARLVAPTINDYGQIYNGYFGDTWKMTPKLTVNLGGQYVYASPPLFTQGGVKNAISIFDLDTALTQPNATDWTFAYLWCSTNPITGAPPNCPRNSIMNPDRKDWSPRLGIAYSPLKKTVIRTGFGMFFDFNSNIEQNSIRISQNQWPYSNALRISGGQNTDFLGPLNPPLSLSNPYPVTTPGAPAANFSINRFSKSPYAMEWNFGIEQLLPGDIKLSVDYVGSGGRRLQQAYWENMAILGPGSIASRQPLHNASAIPYRNTDGNSNYNSLQMKLERAFKSGLTFMNSFTWAKSFDTVSDANNGLGPPGYTYNAGLSYGRSDFNVPVINTTSFVYHLPFGRGRRFGSNIGGIPDQIVGGWEGSGIISIRSGFPYTVMAGSDVANLGIDPGEVGEIVSPAVPSGFTQTRAAWFNTSAFQLPAFGTLGNSSRNFLNGPASQNVDFGLMKNFRIRENLKLQFRSEFFNVFNHTNFGNPDSSLADVPSGNFGQIFGAYGSRQIQFALKLLW